MNKVLDIFDNVKWTAAFEVTQFCNMACDICGINSGPHAPFRFLDSDRIGNILKDAKTAPNFSNSYILSGGEVTTAYAFDREYISRLLKAGRDLKMRCTIRTNGKLSDKNLKSLSEDLVPYAAMGTAAHKRLRIGLSLDDSHKNSFDYNLNLVKRLTTDIGLSQRAFFIVSVGDAHDTLTEFARQLDLPVTYGASDNKIQKIGQIDVQNEVHIYNAGRAMENNIGNEPVADLQTALTQLQNRGMIWFSVNNTASFIYNFNTLLSTPLRDNNGTDKSLHQIMTDLRAQCAARLKAGHEL